MTAPTGTRRQVLLSWVCTCPSLHLFPVLDHFIEGFVGVVPADPYVDKSDFQPQGLPCAVVGTPPAHLGLAQQVPVREQPLDHFLSSFAISLRYAACAC